MSLFRQLAALLPKTKKKTSNISKQEKQKTNVTNVMEPTIVKKDTKLQNHGLVAFNDIRPGNKAGLLTP